MSKTTLRVRQSSKKSFASVAVGGTPSSYWLPGAEGYPLLLAALTGLGPGGARAVLWHQGESDSLPEVAPEQYRDNLRKTIGQLPVDAGWCPPWVVAGVSYHPEAPAVTAPVAGQALLWREGTARQGPYTDDMLGALYRCDTVHFSEYGLRAHAERWFALLWAQFYARLPLGLQPERQAADR